MSKIWGGLIGSGIIYCFFDSRSSEVVKIVTESSQNAVSSIITIVGIIGFWSGIFNIIKNTSIVDKISKIFEPIIFKIMKKDELNEECKKQILINISTNILGIGNAATVSGITAMKEMQKTNNNKRKATDNMAIFVLLNTASMQIFPTTIISLRQIYGSNSPNQPLFGIWICSIVSLIIGLISIKIILKKSKKG